MVFSSIEIKWIIIIDLAWRSLEGYCSSKKCEGSLRSITLRHLFPTRQPLTSETPVNMESLPVNNNNGQSYGYTLYETAIGGSGGTLDAKNHVRDRALVRRGGQASAQHTNSPTSCHAITVTLDRWNVFTFLPFFFFIFFSSLRSLWTNSLLVFWIMRHKSCRSQRGR